MVRLEAGKGEGRGGERREAPEREDIPSPVQFARK